MNKYIGVKEINAKPMNRQEYNDFRGWELPEDENGNDDGFLVEYIDGGIGNGNTKEFNGYVSWSPKDVFERAYRKTEGMSFGLAIEAMKKGKKVARSGWNGKGMYCIYVSGSYVTLKPNTPYHNALTDNGASMMQNGSTTEILPHIDMWTVNSDGRRAFLPGWLASQTDMLADDWEIIE